MKKISMVKYHQLNAAIRTIRDFCTKNYDDCTDCPFWIKAYAYNMGEKTCAFARDLPEDWEELPKEVLDKE